MKVKTIALLVAAGCAAALLTMKNKGTTAAGNSGDAAQPGGTQGGTQDGTKTPVVTVPVFNQVEPKEFYKGQQVKYNGKGGYYIASANHPTYVLMSTGIVQSKVIADAKELTPA